MADPTGPIATPPAQVTAAEVPDHQRRAARVAALRQVRGVVRMLLTGGALLGLGLYAWQKDRQVTRLSEALERVAGKVTLAVARDDGTFLVRERFDTLPVRYATDGTLNALWTYVLAWGCYSPSTAIRDSYRIQKMSSPQVKEQWLRFFSVGNTERSPQHLLGRKGWWQECRAVGIEDRPGGSGTYGFRFERQTRDDRGGAVGRPQTMYMALSYRTGVYDPDPEEGWRDLIEFNAPGVHVTQVTEPYPEGAARVAAGGPR